MSETDHIRCDIADGVAVITLDRAEKRNALSGDMIAGLGAAYSACDVDDDVRVVVLTGAGTAFCAGADLSPGKSPFGAVADVSAFRSSPVRPRAWEVRKPVIAAVNGAAIGIGCSIALQADMRIVAFDAPLAVLQARRGVIPDAQSHWVLPRLVGAGRAAQMLVAGRTITGSVAAQWGLANEAVAAVDVLPTAMEWALDIATNVSPLSAATSKRILWRSLAATADEVDELER
ncbi:MAG: enoyl-CoA hydratase/carnithine racemase, partial [Ilumatobacteraceae bacterium]|nr:enoyl-CoA hydratase/carnithine racemase [Ilumatobacteraceae bacterium]